VRSRTVAGRPAIRLLFPLLLVAALAAGCRSRGPEGLALVGATVIDGSGRAPLTNAVVIIRGTHIDTIVPAEGFKVPRRMQVVDLTGKWIIPGLIDAHAHVSRWALRRYLAYGVTSVRDLHGNMDSILPLRRDVNLNSIAGPRIYAAGAMIDGVPPTYPDAFAVRDQRQARRAVDSLVQAGADLVKLYTRIDPELMRAITDEARTFQMRVAAHLGLTDAVTAANLGVRSIEHLSGVPEAASSTPEVLYAAHRAGFFKGWTAFEKSWATLDSTALQRVADALVARRVILVPTLVLHETYANLDDPATYTDSALKAVPRPEIERWNTADMIQRAGWTRADFEAFRASRPKQDLFLRLFYMGRGIIATGTDASNQQIVPGESEHRELQLLVRAGIPPEDALLAATRNAALLIGADSIGTLAPGRVADLLVLTRNPFENIENTRSIQYVMARGNLMPADSLRRGF
jgi:imidazolonepropionase-like amidohydrolase